MAEPLAPTNGSFGLDKAVVGAGPLALSVAPLSLLMLDPGQERMRLERNQGADNNRWSYQFAAMLTEGAEELDELSECHPSGRELI